MGVAPTLCPKNLEIPGEIGTFWGILGAIWVDWILIHGVINAWQQKEEKIHPFSRDGQKKSDYPREEGRKNLGIWGDSGNAGGGNALKFFKLGGFCGVLWVFCGLAQTKLRARAGMNFSHLCEMENVDLWFYSQFSTPFHSFLGYIPNQILNKNITGTTFCLIMIIINLTR